MVIRTDFGNARFPVKVIGSGEPQAKTRKLDIYEPLVHGARLHPLPRMAFTSDFFTDFLERNGINNEPTGRGHELQIKEYELQSKVMAANFTKAEEKIFWEIIGPLKDFALAVRSDEFTAAGTGIFESRLFLNSGTKEERLKTFSEFMGVVIASQFAPPAAAFKRRIGAVGSRIGVQVCPVIGENIEKDASSFDYIFSTLMSGSGYSSYRGQSRLYVEPGLGGGVNSQLEDLRGGFGRVLGFSLNESPVMAFEAKGGERLHTPHVLKGLSYLDIKLRHDSVKLFGELYGAVEKLGVDGVPKYFELAAASLIDWIYDGPLPFFITQITDFILPDVAIPEEAKNNSIWKAREVIGSGTKQLDGLIFVDKMKISDIPKMIKNKGEKRFAAVIYGYPVRSEAAEALSHFDNVDAIIYITRNKYPLHTHAGGCFRESGIIVMSNPREIQLEREQGNKVVEMPLEVYASEKTQEGYVCLRTG